MSRESWQQHLRDAIKSNEELSSFFGIKTNESVPYPILLPRNFAKKIRQQGPDSALWRLGKW